MKTRALLAFALSLFLASPVFAQSAPAAPPVPAPPAAPADNPVTPVEPAPEAAPPEVIPEPPPAPPAVAPAPLPIAPAPAPAPVVAPAPAPAPVPIVAPPPAVVPKEPPPEECALGQLCFGPVLSAGLFNPLGIGAHARYGEHWGFGIDYQFLPSVGDEDANFSIGLLTLNGRLYPFGGAFFLGAGFAYQSFSATGTSVTVDETGMLTTVRTSGSVGIPTWMLGLGFMGRDGFVMGIDLALEIPLGGTDVKFDDSAPGDSELAKAYEEMQQKIKDKAEMAVTLLPFLFQLNLIRIGYLF